MSIRRATADDITAIHPLLEQLMPAPVGRRHLMWQEVLRDENYAAWIADVDGAPAGFVDLFIFPDVAHGNNIGVISNLVIDERFRGRGLGEETPARSDRTLQAAARGGIARVDGLR